MAHLLMALVAKLADLSSGPWTQVVETELTHAYCNIVSTCADPQIQMRKNIFSKVEERRLVAKTELRSSGLVAGVFTH